MRAKKVNMTNFKDKYSWDNMMDMLPSEISNIIELSKNDHQRLDFHPEDTVYNHIKIVYERALETEDINFIMAAIFHDIGKHEAAKPNPKTDDIQYSGHEHISSIYTNKYRDWIESMGCDFDIVYYIVNQHMRAHQLPNMRKEKKMAMITHPLFPNVEKFSTYDDMLTYHI